MFQTNFKRYWVLFACLLSACQSVQPPPENAVRPVQQALQYESAEPPPQTQPLQALPTAVAQALRPQKAEQSSSLFGHAKYDISAEQVDAKAFFNSLVKNTPYSVALHPNVSGNISIDLKQVELDQVFELIADIYGFDIQRKDTIYRVRPAGMRTETFAVNYLLMQRTGMTQTSIQSGGVTMEDDGNNSNNVNNNSFSGNATQGNNIGGNNSSNGTSIATLTNTDFWSDLQETLQVLVGSDDGRSVMVTPQAGLVTVRAWPDEIRAVKAFLQTSEQSVQRQVILEARIVEVSLSDDYQQGINWTQVLANADSTDFQFSSSANALGNNIVAEIGGITSLAFVNQDFSGLLSLLSTQGNVQTLSSPRVTVTNNQKAVIKVGDDEYFVTSVTSESTITNSSTQVTPNIELTPFFSGIALDVTPQIDDKGSVLLHVHPSVIETAEQEKIVTIDEQQYILPLAQSNIRESDTVIRAQSGEIVVIGGLMQSIISERDSKTPILGSIPLLGELFTNRSESEIKRELVILLKPTVVGENTWQEQIQQTQSQIAEWLYVD